MKGGNLYTVMKTTSLLKIKLFETHSIALNATMFLMQKLDLEKWRSSAQKKNCWPFKYHFNKEQIW